MFKRQHLQATAYVVPTKNGSSTVRALSTYPTVPAVWPNRATRRAVKQNREHRLPAAWRGFLAVLPDAAGLRTAIRAL